MNAGLTTPLHAALQRYLEVRENVITRFTCSVPRKTALGVHRLCEALCEDLASAQHLLAQQLGDEERVAVTMGSTTWTVERCNDQSGDDGLIVRPIVTVI